MYSTWNKNETKEIIKLGVKFGKIVPSQNKCPTLNEPNSRFGETRVMPIPRPKLAKKDIFIISNDDDFLLHIKTKISIRVLLNFPFLGTTFVYNMFPRKMQKLLPRTILPHQYSIPSPMQTNLLHFHTKILRI
jgi:hypothetical protein